MAHVNELWTKEPRVLLKTPTSIIPRPGMTSAQSSNAVARLLVLVIAISFALTMRVSVLIVGVACLLALAYIQKHKETGAGIKESFVDLVGGCVEEDVVELQAPSRSNPLMNVMLTDYKDDPERPPAAPAFNPVVEADINQKAVDSELYPGAGLAIDDRSKLYQDLGDELVFDQSMRNFYAMPNTTIPNAQDAFAKYCYGDMPSCRDGNEQQCWKNVNSLQTRTA